MSTALKSFYDTIALKRFSKTLLQKTLSRKSKGKLPKDFLNRYKKANLCNSVSFRGIFVIAGPLSRYLQSVNIDLGKALAMIDSCLSRLQRVRNDPDEIIKTCENERHQAKWKESDVEG